MKKSIAFIAALSLIFGSSYIANECFFDMMISVNAEENQLTEGACGKNAEYAFDAESGTLIIRGTGDMYDYNITNSQLSPFCSDDNIKKIIIENGITSIGGFDKCENLKSVIIPESVSVIKEKAFLSCPELDDITVPENAEIGAYAFENCKKLSSVKIPASVVKIGESAFENTAWYDNQPDGMVYINKVAYKFKGNIPEFALIRYGIVSISDNAFGNSDNLKDLFIPYSVTDIGKLHITEGMTIYGNSGDTAAEKYAKENNIKFLALAAYNKVKLGWCGNDITYRLNTETGLLELCGKGPTINYFTEPQEGGIVSGYSPFFEDKTIKKAVIQDGITCIGSCLFADCYYLEEVSLPDSVVKICDEAFLSTGIRSVKLPENLETLGNHAIGYSLEEIYIPKSAATIGEFPLNRKNLKIYGYAGTEAQKYAESCQIPFIDVEQPVTDIDGDGKTTSEDALAILQITAGYYESTEIKKLAADIDGDGEITAYDALIILQGLVGENL